MHELKILLIKGAPGLHAYPSEGKQLITSVCADTVGPY
jgi:hypothetical protein